MRPGARKTDLPNFVAIAVAVMILLVSNGWPDTASGQQKKDLREKIANKRDAKKKRAGNAKKNSSPDRGLVPPQLFVPAPRELSRPLTRARKAMDQQNYREAVELLGAILASPLHGDYLQPVEEYPFRAVSIHNQAHRLLGQISRQHRKDYELRYQVTARQMLERAVRDGDFSLMARVSRHYFYTDSGYHATLLLGHHYLEMGQPVSAASCFSSLVEDEYARQKYEPEVSVMLATCWLLTGNRVAAQATLEELAALRSGQRIQLYGREVALFSNSKDAIPWLVEVIGNGPLAGYKSVDDWLMFRGDAERNASSGSGFPLPYARWYVPTINDPEHEQLAESVFQDRMSTGKPLIPALHPIAAGETIVVRSLDKMIGIDYRSGKRVWEFPAWDRKLRVEDGRHEKQARKNQTEDWHVEQRLWQDHLYGQVTSNGRYVFVIDEPGYASPANQRSIVARGVPINNPVGGRQTNELKAIDLTREGAFCWEAGGKTGGTVAELAGCFFLGAPLVLENELYILGELGGEISLIVLDQETGKLIWTQQIAAIDSAPPVTQDRLRRLAGATPSSSNGIIVCPTSATGIVAVERSTRSLLWGVQYPGVLTGAARSRVRQANPVMPSRSVDATVTIADGRIVAMPLENDQIHGFDLLTGKSLWVHPADDALYIACIHHGQVVVVGQQNIRALDLETGKPVWMLALEKYGQPTGRGFQTGNQYFLPTSEARIIALDLKKGSVTRSIDTQRVLGNLVCYKDELISQGFDVVSVYPQAARVREYVARYDAATMSDDPEVPAQILLWQAQLQAQDGQLAKAVVTADRAFQTSGERREKQLLLDLILQLMESDYPTVKSIADKYAVQLREYGQLKYEAALFSGLLQDGSVEEAMSILNEPGADPGEFVRSQASRLEHYRNFENGSLRMRLDVWLHRQLQDRMNANASVAKQVLDWTRDHAPDMHPRKLATFAELLGPDRVPPEQMLRLARWYVSQSDFAASERILNMMGDISNDPGGWESLHLDADRQALKYRMAKESGWTERARKIGKEFLVLWEKASFPHPWTGEKTSGREFATEIFNAADEKNKEPEWNYGQVHGQMESTESGRRMLIRTMAFPEIIAATNNAIEDIRLEVNFQDTTLVIRNSQGLVLAAIPYRDNPSSRNFYSPRSYNGSSAIHGNLLIFCYGYDLMAVDLNRLRSEGTALLWQKNLQQNRGVDNRSGFQMAQPRPINADWGTDRFLVYGKDEPNPVGNFASNASHVFCRIGKSIQCLDAWSGKLIWQRSSFDEPGWLIADDQHVALLQNDNSTIAATYKSAVVMSARTGEILKTVDLQDYSRNVLWHNVGLKLVMSGQASKKTLAMFDLLQGKEQWTRRWPESTRAVIRDPRTMVFVSPDGLLEYFDLVKGRVIFSQQLDSDIPVETFRVMKMQNQDLLYVGIDESRPNQRPDDHRVTIRHAFPGDIDLFDGWIYSVNPRNGELDWTNPVRLEHYCIPQEHPIDTPLLTVNRLVIPGLEAVNSSQSVIELMTFDLRDGRLVDEQRIRNWRARFIEVSTSPDNQTVIHNFADRKLTLRLGREDFPPAAPASLTNDATIPETRAFAAGNGPAADIGQRRQNVIRDIRERNRDD